jgi:hypothetical protein
MADVENEVLTREKAQPQNILPTGRKIGIQHVKGTSMYKLHYLDGAGELPDRYKSFYTGISQANKDLKQFVSEFWDISDKASTKKKNAVS